MNDRLAGVLSELGPTTAHARRGAEFVCLWLNEICGAMWLSVSVHFGGMQVVVRQVCQLGSTHEVTGDIAIQIIGDDEPIANEERGAAFANFRAIGIVWERLT